MSPRLALSFESIVKAMQLRERVQSSPSLVSSGGETRRLVAGTDVGGNDKSDRGGHSVQRLRRLSKDCRIRWSILSPKVRLSLAAVTLVLAFQLLFATLDVLFRTDRSTDLPAVDNSDSQGYAVVVNTYKRPVQLGEAVRHYADDCGRRAGVKQVFVIWAELDVTPPDPSTFFSTSLRKTSTTENKDRSFVEIVRVQKDSLNSRFLPISGLTADSIFMVDDDVHVSCASLEQGFRAWQSNPDSMVGYYPRLAVPPRAGRPPNRRAEYVYHSWLNVFWRQETNLVLTKASFLHARYLESYSSDVHPQEIKDYVDKYMNCEDVAMSLLVANMTASESGEAAMPIYVEGSIADKGLFNGISTGGGHFTRRSDCLTDLSAIYQEHGWGLPLEQTFDLGKASWIQHYPGFWWQAGPSNVFEWLAITNPFS